MNFDSLLKVGETKINEYIVKKENTADFIGNKGIEVLSTPSMIGFMECTAFDLVAPNIPEGYRPVGTKINIEHISSTPINTKVKVKATLAEVNGRKLVFNVEAFNEKCKIGQGTCEQHIINIKSFLSKQ
jgi:predicted thioesterase